MKFINRLFALMGAAMLFAGCDGILSGKTYDFTCYSVSLNIVDAKTGLNLLDPDNENNILAEDLYVEYNGEEYRMVDEDTRTNMPRALALRYVQYVRKWNDSEQHFENVPSYHLEFGEFSPEHDYHSEEFTIHWEDGTTDNVRFDCYVKWRVSTPKVFTTVRLNGVKLNGWECTFER